MTQSTSKDYKPLCSNCTDYALCKSCYFKEKEKLQPRETAQVAFSPIASRLVEELGLEIPGHIDEETAERWMDRYCGIINRYFDAVRAETRKPASTVSTVYQEPEDPDHDFKVGEVVRVYDRYRFAISLKGRVNKFSSSNDGVEVILLESNNANYPVSSYIWVHTSQLRRT